MAVKATINRPKGPRKGVFRGSSLHGVGHPPAGWVRILCSNPFLNLIALIGPENPRVTDGVGGWVVTPRPRQSGMTTWEGNQPWQLTFEMMLDGGTFTDTNTASQFTIGKGWEDYDSQEPAIRALYSVAAGDTGDRPGIVRIVGIPSLPAERWVIESIEEGEAVRRAKDFHRVRLAMTITLREYVPPQYLKLKKGALQGTKGGKAVTIKVKHGDTPAKIAKRRGVGWKVIAELNPGVVKKANQNLKDGSRIRVPVTRKHEKKK
jgi:LysM repeat protein